jgi:anti-sigma regulatory factor (Ser/Thr protein kinase)
MRTDATLPVDPDPRSVAVARRLVRQRWADLAEATDLAAVQLLVSELVTNVIRHTDAGEGELRLQKDDRRLRVEVEDRGPGVPDTPVRPNRRAGRGFGLALVEHFADRWGVRGRNCVWFEMDLQRAHANRRFAGLGGRPQPIRPRRGPA